MSQPITHLDQLDHLVKRLPFDVLGRFEPMTGLVVVNMPKSSYLKALRRFGQKQVKSSDLTLIRMLNHETCHFTQCLSSGYMGYRNRVLWHAFKSWRNRLTSLRFFWLNLQSRLRLWVLRCFFAFAREGKARAYGMAQMMHDHNRMVLVDRITKGCPNSVARLNFAHYFQTLDSFRESEGKPGVDGVSTLGIIEGAAVAYCALMEPEIQTAHAFAARMVKDTANMPPVYSELWNLLQSRAKDRASELMLPLAALSLQYARPDVAVGPMLERLLVTPPGRSAALARQLFTAPPDIPEAGKTLKPAQHYRDSKRRAALYDIYIDSLRGDDLGLDDYQVLTDVTYLNRVTSYSLCAMFSDGKSIGALMSNEEIAVRRLLAAQALEVESRGRDERDGKNRMVDYFRGVMHRNLGI